MWQHLDLREVYRKAGYKESHFLIRNVMNRNSSGGNILLSPNSSANNTLSRPMSTQSGTRFEDRTLPRNNRNMNEIQLSFNRVSPLPISSLPISSFIFLTSSQSYQSLHLVTIVSPA